ncbi:DUF4249 domain-containing protein [Pedobacter frigiditerrae]|uniref:DUF4249 domain-containing protein n=1 Tax=Pedobacter frigiditerrae TaxID=2530452 RepID=A0A4R0MT02_9SPHI|nr:DUF4249 domain-containing protein [Pedobacter frigiditerrae]TCC90161.1 DUF4249 domain-containing protein [Pedobacter frigiditerrae]
MQKTNIDLPINESWTNNLSMRKTYLSIVALLLLLSGCKENFNPVVAPINTNILVVEGMINAGADSTIINLSRTVLVSEKTTTKPEIGATLTVESESNQAYPLSELTTKKGTYGSLPLNLDPSKKYRLRIRTANGTIYLSDFVETKVSPVIDLVGYDADVTKGLQIYVNTKDQTNKSRYYRWEYEETWIFYSAYQSLLMWDGKDVVGRSSANSIYQCWGNTKSSTIVLGSSVKLDKDVIFKQPIILNPSTSEKFTEKYSILVKQYTLTKEAYDFWQNLKKNTESLGSIFDAQPSQLTGNIHNQANPLEPVIGFISAGTIQKQRIYITKGELPGFTKPLNADCNAAVVEPTTPLDFPLYFQSGFTVPIAFVGTGVLASSKECVDCTLRGTNKKPAFWQ